jgi:putative transposase
MVVPRRTNERWSLVADQFIDVHARTAPASAWRFSGIRVARELDRLLLERGKPGTIVSENGTELTSTAILQWADDHKVAWDYIAPGKPV